MEPYGRGTYARQESLPPDLISSFGSLIDQGVRETDPARRALIYQQFNQGYYNAASSILLAVGYLRHYEQRWVQGYYYNAIYSSFYFYALSKQ